MAKVSNSFVDETLWPQYLEFSKVLEGYLSQVTERVVHQVLHQDSSDIEVVEKPQLLNSHLS